MIRPSAHFSDAGFDPVPRYASDAEIEIAQQLRQALEKRYFGCAGEQLQLPERSDERH